MSAKKKKDYPLAFTPPIYANINYNEVTEVARQMEQLIIDTVVRDRWTFDPKRYHSTELSRCMLWKGWDRFTRSAIKNFNGDRGANILFIGNANHENVGKIIKGGMPEFESIVTFDDIEVSFHIDVFRPFRTIEELSEAERMTLTDEQIQKRLQAVIYEIKTKESLFYLFDQNVPVQNRLEKHDKFGPTSLELNQIIPYMVQSNANVGFLIFIPKMRRFEVLSYQVLLDAEEWKEQVMNTLENRAKQFADLEEGLLSGSAINMSLIEPSSACNNWCSFRLMKTKYTAADGTEYHCPVKLLPKIGKLRKEPLMLDVYNMIWNFLQHSADRRAEDEQASLDTYDLAKRFYVLQQTKPDFYRLNEKEAITILQRTMTMDEGSAKSSIEALLGMYPNLKNKELRYLRRINDSEILQIFPLKERVAKGWSPFLFKKHGQYPYISEISELAGTMRELMIERLYPTDVVVSGQELAILRPYDYKGFFGCPRYQRFANIREIPKGFTDLPIKEGFLSTKSRLGMIKIWFIDMSIHARVRRMFGHNNGELFTTKFDKYSFQYPVTNMKRFGIKSPLLVIPIYRTEWRVPKSSIKIKNPSITPREKHTKQAALLASIIDAPVLLMYYPRKRHGDIRLYAIRPEDPEIIQNEAKEWIKAVDQDIPKPSSACRTCLMIVECDEGQDFMTELIAKEQAEGVTEEESDERDQKALTI
jgi:hypothetical protein